MALLAMPNTIANKPGENPIRNFLIVDDLLWLEKPCSGSAIHVLGGWSGRATSFKDMRRSRRAESLKPIRLEPCQAIAQPVFRRFAKTSATSGQPADRPW